MARRVNPATVQQIILEWVGVATVVAGALAGFIGVVIGLIAKIKADAAARLSAANHAASLANHEMSQEAIAALQRSLTNIALLTAPPGANKPNK